MVRVFLLRIVRRDERLGFSRIGEGSFGIFCVRGLGVIFFIV